MKEIIDLDIPPANPAPAPVTQTDIEKKDLLIENYLPNLSSYQEVIKKVKIEGEDEKTVKLYPNVNYTDEKDYYIFYNNNLKKLIDLHKDVLTKELLKHNVILYHKEDNLNGCLKELGFDPSPDKSSGPFKFFSRIIGNTWYQRTIDLVNLIATNLGILTDVLKEFSDKISQEKMCAVTISENLFDEKIKITKFIKNSENNEILEYIREIEGIKEKQLDDEEKLKLMNKKINELKKEIQVEKKIENILKFCFILNYISEYVHNFERSLETKEYPLLQVMDSIRRKLDYYLLTYRYKFVENQSPILNIKIHRYKIICDSQEKRTIYFEKGEARKFMKNLEEEINKKAKNIDRSKQFEDIGLKDIIEIAKQINFNGLDDLIKSIDEKIVDYQSEYKSKKIELISSSAKELVKFSVNALSGLELNINGISKQIPFEKIQNFIETDKGVKEAENEAEKKTETEENKGKNEIIEEKNDKFVEGRKKNLKKIGIETKDMGREIINHISKSLYLYNDMKTITYNIKKYTIMKNRIVEKKDYNYDFYNGLKLYCYMIKKKLEINDYSGIILEEGNKEKADELREYTVKKLTELQND